MAYSKKAWITGDVITAADMNRMEDGINSSQSMYNFKGKCKYANLPASGNNVNDTYYVTDQKASYTWNGSEWVESGGVSLSMDEIDAEIESILEPTKEEVESHDDYIKNMRQALDALEAFCRKEVTHEESYTVPVTVGGASSTKTYLVDIPASTSVTVRVDDPDGIVKEDASITVYASGTALVKGKPNTDYTVSTSAAVTGLTVMITTPDILDTGTVTLSLSWVEKTTGSLEFQTEYNYNNLNGYIGGVQTELGVVHSDLTDLQKKVDGMGAGGGLSFKGDILSFDLPDLASVTDGDIYRITDAFTTDDTFLCGSGVSVAAGANAFKVTTDLKKYEAVSLGYALGSTIYPEDATEPGDEQGAEGYAMYSLNLSKVDKSSKYRLISSRTAAEKGYAAYLIGAGSEEDGTYTVTAYEKTDDTSKDGKRFSSELAFTDNDTWLFINSPDGSTPTLEKITETANAARWNLLGGTGTGGSGGSSVYIGAEEPPAGSDYDLWLNPDGEADDTMSFYLSVPAKNLAGYTITATNADYDESYTKEVTSDDETVIFEFKHAGKVLITNSKNQTSSSVLVGQYDSGIIYGDPIQITSIKYSWKANSVNDGAGSNLFDGNTGTWWGTTEGFPCWVQISPQVGGFWPTLLEMYPRSSWEGRTPKEFIVQGSDDGTTWNDIKAFTNTDTALHYIQFDLSDVSDRFYKYIRVYITSVVNPGNYSGTTNISELRLSGYHDSNYVPPEQEG